MRWIVLLFLLVGCSESSERVGLLNMLTVCRACGGTVKPFQMQSFQIDATHKEVLTFYQCQNGYCGQVSCATNYYRISASRAR